MNIQEISKRINENNHSKGFWEGNGKPIDIPQKLLLIISEVCEAMEADRIDKRSDESLNGIPDSQEDCPFFVFESFFKKNIKDTVEDELADAVIRIFDLAYEMDIDLAWHIAMKVRYNEKRPFKHGGKKY